ncbi:MAG: ribosome assembly RNA-binding protein YhbY [Proteobacteria bacterium]|nr:ribosome assembly RNA-binding protein YhbY [Pseudomonadota bacterium]
MTKPDTPSQAAANTPVVLSERQKRHLRGLAHPLKPLIRIGNAGVTDPLVREMGRALEDHELIKVKAPGGDRGARDAMLEALATRSGSTLVQRIGNVAVFYRPHPKLKKILIPDT